MSLKKSIKPHSKYGIKDKTKLGQGLIKGLKECVNDLVECLKCTWVSFAVTREYAEDEVKRFNEFFSTLTKEDQQKYYKGEGSSLKSYTCQLCGGSKFKKTNREMMGHTINPVIFEEET